MAKGLSKSEKLDLVVSEIAKVKNELRKLIKQQAALAGEINRLSRAASARQSKKTARKLSAADNPAPPDEAPKRPVLVQTSETAPPAGRAVSP